MLGDVALETVAGPTSVLKATAVASSAAASVASQSPGWANTSNLAPVPVFLEESGTSARQKCRASTEAIAPIRLSFTLASAGAVFCGHRGDLSGHTRIVTPLLVAACDFKNTKMHVKQYLDPFFVIFENRVKIQQIHTRCLVSFGTS